MKTIEQLRAEHVAQEQRLAAELALAAKAQFTPDSVQLNNALGPWLVYRKRTLSEALAMFRASVVVPCARYKGTFTRITPDALAKPDCGERIAGPFAIELAVSQGEGFGPSADLSFFTMAGDTLCRARIGIEGPGYIGNFHALGASVGREERDGRGRLVARSFNPNALLNGLFDSVVGWASGDLGPIKKSAHFSYLLMADQDATGPGADNAHACAQMQNLIDATAPKQREEG